MVVEMIPGRMPVELLAAVVAVAALIVWQRQTAVSAARDHLDVVLLAIAGAWVGWTIYPEVHSILSGVPV